MEVLIVMAILVVLGTLVTTQFFNVLDNSKVDAAKIQMQNFVQPLELYKLNVTEYPETLEALIENVDKEDKWLGPYLKADEIPKDPWNNDYDYTKVDRGFKISSGGSGDDAEEVIELIVAQ
jgi:general secretion pathway protein G